MKKVLFIGVTNYNLARDKHLQAKYQGLAVGLKVYVIARGKPFYKNIWGCRFILLPSRFLYWLLSPATSFFICLFCKIDAVVSQSPLLEGLLGVALKTIFRKELIIEAHGDFIKGPFLNKKRFLPNLQKKLVIKIAKFSLRRANKVRAISKATKEQALLFAGNKPCYVFPTFTNIDDFLREPPAGLGDYILFVGALEKVKGVEYLLRALSQISEVRLREFKISEVRPSELVIVGEGSERSGLEQMARDFGIAGRVKFLGRLSLEETRKVMRACYCLVLPSLSEGLGRVLLEAGALGKPLIGSNVGGIPDIIKENKTGFLVKPADVDDLKEKLLFLLSNKEMAIQMGKNVREFVKENFSNQRYVSAYKAMINV